MMGGENLDTGSIVASNELGGNTENLSSSANRKPRIKEWALTFISGVFVLISLFLLPSDPGIAILTLVLMGFGLIYFPARILERRRLSRAAPLYVSIVGGVPIRSSRLVIGTVAGWLATSGTVGTFYFSVHFMGKQGAYADIIGCVGFSIVAALGCYLLAGIITGRWPNEYLQFDPLGLTIGRGRWSYTVPWDNIVSIGVRELCDNFFVLISLDTKKSIIAHSEESLRRASKQLARNRRLAGADVALNTTHFRLDAQLLVHALYRYVTQASARAELSRRQIEQL
jgi:hypothetical protein